MDHTILEDGLPLVLYSLHLSCQLRTEESAWTTDLIVNTEDDVDVCLVVSFSIIIEFTLAIVQIRVDDLVPWHQTSCIRFWFCFR